MPNSCGERETGRGISIGSYFPKQILRRFTPLIQRALEQRPDPWLRVHRPSTPEAVAQTYDFLEYVA